MSVQVCCAVATFARTPPTASTCPRSVTSPVIAVSERASRPLSSERSAHVTARPADGPSFLTAPAGRCTCRSSPRSKLASLLASGAPPSPPPPPPSPPSALRGARPSWSALLRIHARAARTDSCITSPCWPVRVSSPEPGMLQLSMKSTCHRRGGATVSTAWGRLWQAPRGACRGSSALRGAPGRPWASMRAPWRPLRG